MLRLILSSALLVVGCTFNPPADPPGQLALGDPCAADRQCASGLCEEGACVECREGAGCPSGLVCAASGRCAPEDGPLRHVGRSGGPRRESAEGRAHVGRVGVVPVSGVKEAVR